MTTAKPLLKITDGTTDINLLDISGILLFDWTPNVPEAKSNGVWKDSPLFEGRQLAYRKLGTVIDTFDLKVRGRSQDDAIRRIQELRRLLEKAISYWTDEAQNQPVYLVARAPYETNTRYAVILDYRTPRDANPFKEPFFGCSALVDQFQLAVEHGIWQDNIPGLAECVEISSTTTISPITRITKKPTASADDAYVNATVSAIDTGTTTLFVGEQPDGSKFHTGIRFTNITVPAGSTILHAWVELVGISDSPIARIYAENVDDSSAFSTYGDFSGRALASIWKIWEIPDTSGAWANMTTPDLSGVLQQVIDRPGWASGNDLSLLIYDDWAGGNRTAQFASYDNPTYAEAVLYIDYIASAAEAGAEATCEAGTVYVANKRNSASLTHIYSYDAAPVTWSANLATAATPFAFLPAVPAANDLVYFGIDSSVANSGPFSSLVFDISTAQVDLTTIVWQYYNGVGADGGWETLSVQDNTATTDPFDRTGVHSVHWVPPADVAVVSVNGVLGFWVRAKVTAVGAAPAPPSQDNRFIYTIIQPYVELQADQVGGDLPALARILAANTSDASGGSPNLCANRVLIGSRSLDRGENFTAFINLADEQNPAGVTVALGGGHSTFQNIIIAPSGRYVAYTSDAEEATTEVTITLDNTLSPQYLGRLRAFLRYQYATGSAGDISLQLITTPGGGGLARYSDVFYPQVNTDWQTVDFGVVNIPARSPSDAYGSITFEIRVSASATGKHVHFYDLILLPVDEWHADVVDKSGLAARTGSVGNDDVLDLDSVTFPRLPDQAVLRTASTNRIQGYYQNRTTGLALLQANAAQRLWFFCIYYESGTELSSHPHICHTVQLFRTARYQSARGHR